MALVIGAILIMMGIWICYYQAITAPPNPHMEMDLLRFILTTTGVLCPRLIHLYNPFIISATGQIMITTVIWILLSLELFLLLSIVTMEAASRILAVYSMDGMEPVTGAILIMMEI